MKDIQISIRPFEMTDLAILVDIDHGYHTDYVWQMDFQSPNTEYQINFRQMRLPRSMAVEYPKPKLHLADSWQSKAMIFVSMLDDNDVAGYISLSVSSGEGVLSVSDLVVNRRLRRKGIASMLIRTAQTWAKQQENIRYLMLEMQSKNYPAISMANKLGFDFCGYNDKYFPNGDIALFFSRKLI